MIPTRRASSLKEISPSTPVFQTTQASSTHFGGLEAKANVGAAGSAIQDAQIVGQAATQLAQANAQVGQAIYNTGIKLFDLAHKKTLEDEKRENRSQLNTFSDGSRKILGDLNSLSGQQRVDAAPEARQKLEDLQDQISKLSSNRRVQDGFMGASSVRLGGHLDTIGAGSLKAKNEAIANTNRLAIFTAKQEVVADPSVNSVQISTANAAIAAGEGLRAQGETDPRVIRAAQQAVINDIYYTAISGALSRNNVGRAQDMYNNVGEYSGKDVPVLTGETRIKMGNLLKDKISSTIVSTTALSINDTYGEDFKGAMARVDTLVREGAITGAQEVAIRARLRRSRNDRIAARKDDEQLNLATTARDAYDHILETVGPDISDQREYARSKYGDKPKVLKKTLEEITKRAAERETERKIVDKERISDAIKAISGGVSILELMKNNPGLRETLARDPNTLTSLLGLGKNFHESGARQAQALVFGKSSEGELRLFNALIAKSNEDDTFLIGINPTQYARSLTREHYEVMEKRIERANNRARKLSQGDLSGKQIEERVKNIVSTGSARYGSGGKRIPTSLLGQGAAGIAKMKQLSNDVADWYDEEKARTGKPPSKKDIDLQIQRKGMEARVRVDLENTGFGFGYAKRPLSDEALTIGMRSIGKLNSVRARAAATVPYDQLNNKFKQNIQDVLLRRRKPMISNEKLSHLAGTEVVRTWVLSNIRTIERDIQETKSSKTISRAKKERELKTLTTSLREWEKEEREHEARRNELLGIFIEPRLVVPKKEE